MTSQSRIPRRSRPCPPSHRGEALPYRGTFGDPRPPALDAIALPPRKMPSHDGLRPLKAWRYVGLFGPELMLCAATVRIGPARQSFWALWDREHQQLRQRTALGRGGVELRPGRLIIAARDVQVDVALEETAGIEAVCPSGASYAWTRKQGGIRGSGTATIGGRPRSVEARGVIDDTAGYYVRHTHWRWSAGVGLASDGQLLAWNLVDGVNDPPSSSERTVWIGAEGHEPPPSRFADDLAGVDGLSFAPEATRKHADNFLLLRSSYRQPFGTFSGELHGGVALAEGYGVMEEHDAWW